MEHCMLINLNFKKTLQVAQQMAILSTYDSTPANKEFGEFYGVCWVASKKDFSPEIIEVTKGKSPNLGSSCVHVMPAAQVAILQL